MNNDIFATRWREMRDQLKEWWDKLTDDELDEAGGDADQVISLIQEKYGYTRERAEEEFGWWMDVGFRVR